MLKKFNALYYDKINNFLGKWTVNCTLAIFYHTIEDKVHLNMNKYEEMING